MNRYKIIWVFLGLLLSVICKGQNDNGKIFNQLYFIDSIPGIHNFVTYNENEKRLDSIYNHYDHIVDSLYHADTSHSKIFPLNKYDFRNNRSRIFMSSYTNDKQDKSDSSFIKGFPTFCDCFVDNDSLFITMGAGFFGGFGINVKIFQKKFMSDFYEYTDDVKPFKANLSDTTFDSFVTSKSKYQNLILNESPNFKTGQQISGYLTLTSNYYFEKKQDNKIDTHFVICQVYFTCKTKDKRKNKNQ
jgi:hypothetical protein